MTEDRRQIIEDTGQVTVVRHLSAVIRSPSRRKSGGIVLLVTMVVLLVLAVLGYNLASRVASQRHRDSYIIDYTAACYARDSAIKYAMTTLQDFNGVELVDRPNEPDFSNLFSLSEQEYRRLLEQWAQELAKDLVEKAGTAEEESNSTDTNSTKPVKKTVKDGNISELFKLDDLNEINEANAAEPNTKEPNLLEQVKIRGPYGPTWPLVTEPVEFEIGKTKVRIEIEDENAKFPLGWAILSDEKAKRESEASFKTFCEWMKMGPDEIDALKGQLGQVGSIKSFTVDFKGATQRAAVVPPTPPTRRRGTRPQQTAYKTTNVTPTEQLTKQARDFSRLFHCSIIDTEMLAIPTIESENRKESALKYMSLWGTTQVNINSATRQVLESAFVFGGDAEQIATEIIKERRVKPFASIDELKKKLFGFSTSIDKCKPYITTSSSVFSIHVTATSGVAKTSAVIVVFRDNDKIEKIAVICG